MTKKEIEQAVNDAAPEKSLNIRCEIAARKLGITYHEVWAVVTEHWIGH